MASPKALFITRYRDAMRRMQLSIDEMLDLKKEFVYEGYATGMTDADFTDENSDMKFADLINAAAAVDAIDALLAANSGTHYKAVYRAKRQI